MTNEYRSVEQKIFSDSGIGKGLSYFGRTLYGTLVTPFRIPTFARKYLNKQLLCNKESVSESNANIEGGIAGLLVGLFAEGVFINETVKSAIDGNYTALISLGIPLVITNSLSLCYELGRLSKSKEENLRS